ncbi:MULTISPECIES: hypothetical protein [unclassified Streptomyces]|uniref:hypothetical protein n=1 Tax=unclassified Streptomyces TaxID=2593676 RepID=UPI002E24BF60|nr:hypothetical protein OG217_18065 [Streptomyces sp. NBC_01023]
MTALLHSGPARQRFGVLAVAQPPGPDLLGMVLGLIWGLGSLLAVGGLAYLTQHSPAPMQAGSAAASAPDLPVSS